MLTSATRMDGTRSRRAASSGVAGSFSDPVLTHALDLPGPSRRIRVEPLTPVRTRPAPTRAPVPAAPPERIPERVPEPEPEPAPAGA